MRLINLYAQWATNEYLWWMLNSFLLESKNTFLFEFSNFLIFKFLFFRDWTYCICLKLLNKILNKCRLRIKIEHLLLHQRFLFFKFQVLLQCFQFKKVECILKSSSCLFQLLGNTFAFHLSELWIEIFFLYYSLFLLYSISLNNKSLRLTIIEILFNFAKWIC